MKKYIPFLIIGGIIILMMKSTKKPVTSVDPSPSGPQTLRGVRHESV